MAMVTMAKGKGLTPAAMELQPCSILIYPTTNASQVTSDDTNNSHHDDNSHLLQHAVLIISNTALLGFSLSLILIFNSYSNYSCAASFL